MEPGLALSAAAAWACERRQVRPLLGVSIAMLIFFTAQFATWHWVGTLALCPAFPNADLGPGWGEDDSGRLEPGHDPEGDDRVLEGRRGDYEDVEELVVSEHRGYGVRAPDRVNDGSQCVENAAEAE